MTNWFKLLHIAPSRSSTTVILHPTLNGLFFLYIRMYKCKTISELHLPKTSFAAASQTQGVYFIQSFFLTLVLLRSSVRYSSVVAQTYSGVYPTNKAPCLPSLYFSSTVTAGAHANSL